MILDVLADVLDYIRKDRTKSLAVSIIGFLLIAMVFGVTRQFILLALALSAALIAFIVGEFQLKQIGIELVTFTIVLIGYVYGPTTGLLAGLSLVTVHFILSRSLGPYIIYDIPAMGMVGLLAGYASMNGWLGGDISTIGIALSLLYNLFTGGLSSMITGEPFKEILWSGTNFMLNLVLFMRLAPAVLLLIA